MKGKHFKMQISLIVGVLVLFLVGFGSSSEATVKKYIAKSYFDKHISLIDSEFEDFVKHEISIGSCQMLQNNPNLVPKVVDSDRSLIGEGSHRRLSTRVRLDFSSNPTPQLHSCSWEVIMIERLPSGVFADPFELQHLVQRGVLSDAAVFGDTNLELPSFRSNRSLVEIHRKIEHESVVGNNHDLEIHINLPLHARYPPLGHGFSEIRFRKPELFMRRNFEADALQDSCLILIDQNPKFGALSIVWEVPSGIQEHARIVSVVTFFSAILSALLIVYTSIYYTNTRVCSDFKQS